MHLVVLVEQKGTPSFPCDLCAPIFVISHQPQLTAMGEQHFLVTKDDEHSSVQEIQDQERVGEIARMISGETVTPEALDFAKELFESLQCASS